MLSGNFAKRGIFYSGGSQIPRLARFHCNKDEPLVNLLVVVVVVVVLFLFCSCFFFVAGALARALLIKKYNCVKWCCVSYRRVPRYTIIYVNIWPKNIVWKEGRNCTPQNIKF